jgi:hypothetical protein
MTADQRLAHDDKLVALKPLDDALGDDAARRSSEHIRQATARSRLRRSVSKSYCT